MIKYVLFVVVLGAFATCRPKATQPITPLDGSDSLTTASKQDSSPSANPAGFRLVESRYRTNAGVSVTAYSYNAFGRLLAIKSGPDQTGSQTLFKWINDRVLRTEQYYTNPPWSSSIQTGLPLRLMSYTDTEYGSDGLILFTKNYLVQDGKPDYRSYNTHQYDSGGSIVRSNVYGLDDGLWSYNTYAYDARGNVTTERYYSTQEGAIKLISTTTYEYDNKPNPFATTGRNYIIMDRNLNNITRKRYVREFDVPGVPRTTEERWTYTYRADGYPGNVTYQDGSREEFVYNR
ncbi:hypothetical protein GCM10023187_24590 [Nibrella viscosa]|uniref:YD repeat-containing protein n=1 Tax=Nibrella viscosa TaxID=1084524 RepID=A0ABP8KFI4_9BACT